MGPELFLFTVDGCYTPETQQLGGLDGVLRTASFGSRATARFDALRKAQPTGPLTVMEFWVGWFTTWGGGVKAERSSDEVARELGEILAQGASVNLFVFAGGTSFGFMAGANLDIATGTLLPHITSYDYDGLLNEAGELTPKFHACRKVIAAHTRHPHLCHPMSSVRVSVLAPLRIELKELCVATEALSNGVATEALYNVSPLPLELLGEGEGYGYYRYVGTGNSGTTVLEELGGLPLKLYGVRDFAVVLCDGRLLGFWDRNKEPRLVLPHGIRNLEIFVEVTARVNFGPHVAERKGLVGAVRVGIRPQDERELFGWESRALPMRPEHLKMIPWGVPGAGLPSSPSFCRGFFSLTSEESYADSWLHVPGFSRGFAAVNGFNLGWHRQEGPQLSLYVPSSVLRPGDNEIIVFEFIQGVKAPEALLEEQPRWSRNRAAAVSNQLTEVWHFTRQVGPRRLVHLARDEIGSKRLIAALLAVMFSACLLFHLHQRFESCKHLFLWRQPV